MKSPCYKCPNRYPRCHSECRKYKEYHEKNKERLVLQKKEFKEEHDEKDYKLTMYQRYKRGKGRKQ